MEDHTLILDLLRVVLVFKVGTSGRLYHKILADFSWILARLFGLS